MSEAKVARKPAATARPTKYYSDPGSDFSEEEEAPRRRRQQRGATNLVPLGGSLDNVTNTAQGLVNTAGQTVQGVTGQALSNQGQGPKKDKDTLRLRLDLNLDIEVTLKARIHGDLELALLN